MNSLTRGLGLLLLALAVSGCAVRSACVPAPYLEARANPPLVVPDDLDRPDQRAALRIPERRGAAGRLANDPENCIIEPPAYYVDAGGPNPEGLPVRPSTVAATPPRPADPGATRLVREVTAFLNEWAAAWSARDADTWFMYYGTEYAPAGSAGPDAWREEQRQLFQVPAATRIDADSVAVDPLLDGNLLVRFVQHFGDGTEQRSVLKELLLVPRTRGSTAWRILEERIVDVL